MTPGSDEQSWESYRRMIVDWHNEDVKSHERIDESLSQIQKTLIEIKTERRVGLGVMNVIVPAVIALISVGVAHALGW